MSQKAKTKTNPRNISCWKVFLYALLLLGKRHTCKYFCVISELFSVERSYSAGGQTRGSAQWYLRHYCGATHTTNLWRSWKGTHGKVWYVVVDWIFIIVWIIEWFFQLFSFLWSSERWKSTVNWNWGIFLIWNNTKHAQWKIVILFYFRQCQLPTWPRL